GEEPHHANAMGHLRHQPADLCSLGRRRVAHHLGQGEAVALLAWELEPAVLSPSDQASAAHHDAPRGIGSAEPGEEEDGLLIVLVAVLADAVRVVALALVDAEALDQDG